MHAKQAANGDWTYTLDDFLGSVRGWVDDDQQIVQTHSYDPYGHPTTPMTGFAFTGEPRDANGLQYHRARYYNPSLAGWLSLDPVEGMIDHPMSLNGYSYVEGNPIMRVDPTGKYWWLPKSKRFRKPSLDFENIETKQLAGVVIQAQAVGNPNVHAEYPVTYPYGGRIHTPHIDLMMVDDALSQIRYWEVKPNNPNDWGKANRAIRNLEQSGIPYNISGERFSQRSCVSRQHSCMHPLGLDYDWNNHTWIPGVDYPPKQFLFTDPATNRSWYAGQRYENGLPVKGVIVYWHEKNTERARREIPRVALMDEFETPKLDDRKDEDWPKPIAPGKVIQFPQPGEPVEVPEPQAPAAFSPSPSYEACLWVNKGTCYGDLSGVVKLLGVAAAASGAALVGRYLGSGGRGYELTPIH